MSLSAPRSTVIALAVLLTVSFATAARAGDEGHSAYPAHAGASTCGPVELQDLRQPKTIWYDPATGVLDTTLAVDLVPHPCVPQWDATNKRWHFQTLTLRTYGSPRDPHDKSKLEWTLPGPTFRVRKTYLADPAQPPGPANPVTEEGTRFRLLLQNRLPNDPWPAHHCQPESVTEPAVTQTCKNPPCTYEEKPPACFHGASVTNIHYHGTHVSPQPHQDFVLLNLYSSEQVDPPPPPPDTYNQIGSYQTNIDPFPWNQAPGTHWYHPHFHGSTALQVTNGLSGSLLIQGQFDDWLYGLYGVRATKETQEQLERFEKVLVVQNIQEDLNFYVPGAAAAQPTVNGQANPVIRMRPLEIQRWRFIGATVHAGGKLAINWSGFPAVRQIAQDGVQFAWQNYDRQPFKDQGTTGGVSFDNYVLAPGNRADFLVQAPEGPGTYVLSFDLPVQLSDKIVQNLAGRKALAAAVSGAEAAAGKPALLTVVVEAAPPATVKMPITQGTNPVECGGASPAPNCWPATPYFLRDLPPAPGEPRQIQFSMKDPETGVCTKNAQQRNGFWINDMQYMDECAAVTMTRDSTEDWQIWNDSPLPHPFHIHINPFQVLDNPNYPDVAADGAPFPWMDTIPLPVGAAQADGCNANASVTVRQKFEDFTGAYVIHCHFLGHEDRGMMLNVQTVCQDSGTPGTFGRPQTDEPDNCKLTTPALKFCPPPKHTTSH